MAAELAAKFHIRKVVAYNDGSVEIDCFVILLCLQSHARVGLPVKTLWFQIRAMINPVYPATRIPDSCQHVTMDGGQVIWPRYALGNATLIGDNKDIFEPRSKNAERFFYTIIKNKFIPGINIIPVLFNVDNTIPVKEQCPVRVNLVYTKSQCWKV